MNKPNDHCVDRNSSSVSTKRNIDGGEGVSEHHPFVTAFIFVLSTRAMA